MKLNPQVGMWARITSNPTISQDKFNEIYPQGKIGKIIFIDQFFSRTNGRKLPESLTIRIRGKDSKKYHQKISMGNTVEIFNIK